MRFDLIDLRLFVHIAETASITRGAARAHMALASASARIRGMEKTLGTGLLLRQRRGVTLTPAGQALLHHARLVLQQVETMRGELGTYARGLKGHVRLWCNTAALSEFLPDALATFMARHANVDIDIQERPSYAVAQAVADNRADIGILADSADLTGLETFAFVVDRLVLVMPRGHRFARRRQIALREADGHDFVGLAADSPLQEYVTRHAARSGARTRQRINLPGFDAICRMAARGVGLGVVPEAAARRCRRSMAIAAVRLTDSWALRHLTICVRRLDALPAYTQALVRHLRASGGAGPKPDTTDE